MIAGENWTDFYVLAAQSQRSSWGAPIIILPFFIFGNFVMLSLFIAVILENFETAEEDKQKKQMEYYTRLRDRLAETQQRKESRKQRSQRSMENWEQPGGARGGDIGTLRNPAMLSNMVYEEMEDGEVRQVRVETPEGDTSATGLPSMPQLARSKTVAVPNHDPFPNFEGVSQSKRMLDLGMNLKVSRPFIDSWSALHRLHQPSSSPGRGRTSSHCWAKN